VETVLAFYAGRAGEEGGLGAKSGAVTAVQRTSSDLRLNPHLDVIALDGAWREQDGELAWEGLGHLATSEVGEVLERLVRRMERYLRRSGQLRTLEDEDEDEDEADREDDPEGNLAASAVYGQAPPAGPQWVRRLAPLEPQALAYDKPLCASLDGFTLHAATGALDPAGREALLRYVLRPSVVQERVEQRPDGLVRITLKKEGLPRRDHRGGHGPAVDVLACPTCQGRMKLLALVKPPRALPAPSAPRARQPRYRTDRRGAVRRIGRAASYASRCSVTRMRAEGGRGADEVA
jgi:hypothetical protein